MLAFLSCVFYFQEGGFFVECGAFTGEQRSNTLLFEKSRQWTGLLVEADPSNYRTLKSKNRKAFSVQACLNTEPHPAMVWRSNFILLKVIYVNYLMFVASTVDGHTCTCIGLVKFWRFFSFKTWYPFLIGDTFKWNNMSPLWGEKYFL